MAKNRWASVWLEREIEDDKRTFSVQPGKSMDATEWKKLKSKEEDTI